MPSRRSKLISPMPKSVSGQASWPETLHDKIAERTRRVRDLQELQAEISAIELVMLIQGVLNGSPETGESPSDAKGL